MSTDTAAVDKLLHQGSPIYNPNSGSNFVQSLLCALVTYLLMSSHHYQCCEMMVPGENDWVSG